MAEGLSFCFCLSVGVYPPFANSKCVALQGAEVHHKSFQPKRKLLYMQCKRTCKWSAWSRASAACGQVLFSHSGDFHASHFPVQGAWAYCLQHCATTLVATWIQESFSVEIFTSSKALQLLPDAIQKYQKDLDMSVMLFDCSANMSIKFSLLFYHKILLALF